ncbi:helix-turn-helix domain-containing protein [Microtetraspora malaysiensis]|uniref:helix-turn-helix domain-containing protein n=1 Tax=Microtetraspora malaysiensis TaxID=161358 RepID=UPI003D89DBA3
MLGVLKALRAGRSLADLGKAVRPDRLPRSTLSDLLNTGRCTVETLELFLRACGVPREEWAEWRAARERAVTGVPPGLAGLVRVAAADPRRLGVHAPIDAPGAVGDLPVYVPRDTDSDPRGVRALVGGAVERGGHDEAARPRGSGPP